MQIPTTKEWSRGWFINDKNNGDLVRVVSCRDTQRSSSSEDDAESRKFDKGAVLPTLAGSSSFYISLLV